MGEKLRTQSRVLGPFNVRSVEAPVGQSLLSLPYSEAQGSQLLISLSDSAGEAYPSGGVAPDG